MKILFVLGLEANPKAGGVERVTYVLTRYFLNAGIKVYFYYFSIKELSFPIYSENVEVFFAPDIALQNSNENILFLKNILTKNGIDIVINQGYTASIMSEVIAASALNSRVKIISVLHNTPFNFAQFYGSYKQTITNYLDTQKSTLKNIIKRKLLIFLGYQDYLHNYKRHVKTAFTSGDRFILLSESYLTLFKKIFNVEDQNKIISLGNPISFNDDFSINQINDKKNQVIYVGRLEYHQKRLDRLITAWSLVEKKAPHWKLIIVGGSLAGTADESDYQVKELKRLTGLVESLHLKNIIFAGNKNPQVYYRESKIFCLTSSFEGFPLVLGEAMHYGVVPVVFGSFEAAHDIIDHGVNGFIATPYLIEEYASLLIKLILNESITREMAAKAIEDSKKISIEAIGAQWIKLFEELTE